MPTGFQINLESESWEFMGQIYEALAKAESDLKKKLLGRDAAAAGTQAAPMPEGLEAALGRSNLGRKQIERQNLSELRESLLGLEGIIADPPAWLKQNGLSGPGPRQPPDAGFTALLLGRKRMVLNRIDHSVTRSKVHKLRRLADTVRDRTTRAAIHRELNELEAKDQIVQTEYRLLDEALDRSTANPAPRPGASLQVIADKA